MYFAFTFWLSLVLIFKQFCFTHSLYHKTVTGIILKRQIFSRIHTSLNEHLLIPKNKILFDSIFNTLFDKFNIAEEYYVYWNGNHFNI